ncbi:hypothetical protein [Parasphingopyxis sp.]|uniref:hypothetical protein n=1 Tax=Parasphingopyxis sp. TaxID=1920299 RepID=UPI00261BF3B5|nr:hypothetical protein [Parasphingopyxis sp.]
MTDNENPHTLPARATPADPGWTPKRQRYFLSRLADTGNVLGVCREMDMSRQSVYALRARDAAFARAWQGAMLRHRDALVDICMERATMGVTEEIVVDGELVERTKPDGAMLRHMLNRADRLCDDDSLAARPAHQSELHFEALLDCVDPDEIVQAEGGPPDRAMLLADIAASARWDWKGDEDIGAFDVSAAGDADRARLSHQDYLAQTDPAPDIGPGIRTGKVAGPMGFASDEEAVEALLDYKRIMATPPGEIDTSDLDPAEADEWTDEQWLRAQRSGLTERMFAEEEDCGAWEYDDADGADAPDRDREDGGDP